MFNASKLEKLFYAVPVLKSGNKLRMNNKNNTISIVPKTRPKKVVNYMRLNIGSNTQVRAKGI